MNAGETLAITEAAAACGVARSTIVRALDAGRFPNARKVEAAGGQRWAIPVEDLTAAGYAVERDRARASATPPGVAGEVGHALERLTGDLLPLLERVANAEREAAEARARLEVESERHARALERVEAEAALARIASPRRDLTAAYAGLGLLAYAGLLGLVEVPPALAVALPGVAGAVLTVLAVRGSR